MLRINHSAVCCKHCQQMDVLYCFLNMLAQFSTVHKAQYLLPIQWMVFKALIISKLQNSFTKE